jgi:hypothetical protein
MTVALLTIDTELSPAFHRRGMDVEENLTLSIFGRVDGGEWGIGHQMTRFRDNGLKAVFFVEALASFVFGGDILKRIIAPILEAGHEIQLHVHTEWLEWMKQDPVNGRRGANISEFDLADQCRLLEMGMKALIDAGAPSPVAFRAGNYGANNDTLRALQRLGIRFDTSYNHVYLGVDCEIRCDRPLFHPQMIEGVVEVPITFFEDYPGHHRPLQVAATSASEQRWAIKSCVEAGRPSIVIVSHSFELLNRDRRRLNRGLDRRFAELCSLLQANHAMAPTSLFASFANGSDLLSAGIGSAIRSSPIRTVARMTEQALGTLVYDIV